MAENRGLYKKYEVKRLSGEEREGAAYFVLDVVNDPHAQAALLAYRNSCEKDYPALADEIDLLLAELKSGKRNGLMAEQLRRR